MKRAPILAVALVLLAGCAYAGAFTDNGNGTVTDKNTGLMWQKEDDGARYNWYVAAGLPDAAFNPAAKSVCGGLTLAGYSDWRLPSNAELMSLVDPSVPEPGLPSTRHIFPGPRRPSIGRRQPRRRPGSARSFAAAISSSAIKEATSGTCGA